MFQWRKFQWHCGIRKPKVPVALWHSEAMPTASSPVLGLPCCLVCFGFGFAWCFSILIFVSQSCIFRVLPSMRASDLLICLHFFSYYGVDYLFYTFFFFAFVPPLPPSCVFLVSSYLSCSSLSMYLVLLACVCRVLLNQVRSNVTLHPLISFLVRRTINTTTYCNICGNLRPQTMSLQDNLSTPLG